MNEQTKQRLYEAISCLVEVRTGEDFESECYSAAENLYDSFKNDLDDLWGFDEE